MSGMRRYGEVVGAACLVIGGLQLLGGTRVERGMEDEPTVDSHIRFMGGIFLGHGAAWIRAGRQGDATALGMLSAAMAIGGAARLITRARLGRPHRFHDVLLVTELAAPVVTALVIADREAGSRSPTS